MRDIPNIVSVSMSHVININCFTIGLNHPQTFLPAAVAKGICAEGYEFVDEIRSALEKGEPVDIARAAKYVENINQRRIACSCAVLIEFTEKFAHILFTTCAEEDGPHTYFIRRKACEALENLMGSLLTFKKENWLKDGAFAMHNHGHGLEKTTELVPSPKILKL